MSFIGHAFVDWDDTIAANIRYFHQVEEANAELIARLTGTDPALVRRRGQELDLATARRIGLVKESLSIAWVECYREFGVGTGVGVDPAAEAAIHTACRIPYEVRQELLPGATELLAWLWETGFEVTIWTAGVPEVQLRKVRESGLSRYIHRAEVTLDKTPERLAAAAGDRDLARTFVVGNSIHSDIRPALALGLLSLHIPVETWAYDNGGLDLSDPNYRRVDQVADVPLALAAHFGLTSRVAGIESAG
ncbi:MAG: hypothetical protein JWN15_3459 [Firmicutes bacterium]|nr:hypothetical protein [Bacillota bacterium]